MQLGMSEEEDTVGTTIACYLAQQGANLNHKNHAGKMPLDVITDPKLEEVIKQFATAKYVLKTLIIIYSYLNYMYKP